MAADDGAKFLSFAGDADVLEEDDERNAKQASRNRRIRGLFEKRVKVAEVKPIAFGELEKVASPASSPLSTTELDGKDDEGNPPPWLSLRDEASINLRLHEELLDFASFMRPSPPEMAARQAFVARIGAAAKATCGKSCEVHLFGSSSTGLNLPSADIDVTVCGVEGLRATTAQKRIANWLLEQGEVSKIELVQSARVPVAKLTQRSTGLHADVIINRLDGIETSKFIRDHMEVFPALAPLVLFLKLFLMQRGLHETFGGGLGSYLLVCMVLSFLQRHPSARKHDMHPKTTLGNLLFDLFRHYGQEFRYGQVGISLLNGGSTFDRLARGFDATTRTGQATLCLESPTEAGVDIGARCFKIGVVRAAFNHAYHSLGKIFLSKEAPGPSLLCPMLVSQAHAVVAHRYNLFVEQPAPLLELPDIPDSDEEEDAGKADAKRRKLESDATDAKANFEMMMKPVADTQVQVTAPPPSLMQVDEAELQMLEELGAEDLGIVEVPFQQTILPEQPVFAAGPASPQGGAPGAEVCSCGEIFLPGAKFCSECGAPNLGRTAPALMTSAGVEVVAPEELQLAIDEDEPAPSNDVFAIVGQDEDNLDEAGIFLEVMAELGAGPSPSADGEFSAFGGSPYADDGFVEGLPTEAATADPFGVDDFVAF